MRTRRRRLTIGSSTEPTVLESGRPSIQRQRRPDPTAAPDEAGAVGLPLEVADRLALDGHHVRQPEPRLVSRSRPARREHHVQLGNALGLDEEVRERRVGRIGRRRHQHDLGIRRQLDVPGSCPQVHDRDPAHLGVVFRRDEHVERGGDRAVLPGDLRPVLGEHHLVAVRLPPGGLVAGRPALAAVRHRGGRRTCLPRRA